MEPCKVVFDTLVWQAGLPGARFKVFGDGRKQMRLLELTSEFVELDWCERGHVGCVLQGELEVDFGGKLLCYKQGDGLFIPQGVSARHKARAVTPSVLLFLVESV